MLNLAPDLWHSRLCRIFNIPVEHPPHELGTLGLNSSAQFVGRLERMPF